MTLVSEAAVQDANESVRKGAQRPVVGVAGRPPLVVERPGARAGGEGCEGPQLTGVDQAAVAA